MKFVISIISITFLLAGEIKITSEQYLLDQFTNNISFKMHIIELDKKIIKLVQNEAKQKFHRDKLYYWNIVHGDSTIAYAFLDNVIGKSMPITFMVILGINGEIINTTIIKYREAYGGEIKHTGWLAQFNNRNNQSSYKVGKDIDGITGATISVNSISKGIHKITILYPLIKDQLINE